MSGAVTISVEALVTLADAAGEWACELSNHIAPASWDFGDTESAESQEEQARQIDQAIDIANTHITEAKR